MNVKCRKCRVVLVAKSCLVDNHNEELFREEADNSMDSSPTCQSQVKEQVWFINYDEAPQDITSAFDESAWSLGKLNCTKCSARIGAFNFVQPRRCPCGQTNLPPVWLTKSKVDVDTKNLIRRPTAAESFSSLKTEALTLISVASPTEKYDFELDEELNTASQLV